MRFDSVVLCLQGKGAQKLNEFIGSSDEEEEEELDPYKERVKQEAREREEEDEGGSDSEDGRRTFASTIPKRLRK